MRRRSLGFVLVSSGVLVACGARDGMLSPCGAGYQEDDGLCIPVTGGTGGAGGTGATGGGGIGGVGGFGGGGTGGTGGFGGGGTGGVGGFGGMGGTGGFTGDCCTPHAWPGCGDPAVTQCVCASDPFCCQGQWDSACAVEVTTLGCGDCGTGGTGGVGGFGGFGGGGTGGIGGFGGGGTGGIGGFGGFGGGGTGGVGGFGGGGTGGVGGFGGGGTGGVGGFGGGGTGGVGGSGGTGGVGGVGGSGGSGGTGGVGGVGGSGGSGGSGGTGGGCSVGDCDNDGWAVADGDCCDQPGGCSTTPELVNPGAIEYIGNAVDDDCDGFFDEIDPPCDNTVTNSGTGDPLDYAKALDLCQFTTEVVPNKKDLKWGVISGKLTRADGTGVPAEQSRAVRSKFGTALFPIKGQRFAVLSTGVAAAPGDTNPSHQAFQPGVDTGTQSGFPADWFAANGNVLPNAPGCPGAGQGGGVAMNPVMLTLRLRVPTNAKSFSFNSFFFSAEFPEFVCTTFNDFFVALVDANVTTNPKDKNLAVFIAPDFKRYPIGVNLSYGTNLFAVCDDGPTGCSGGNPGNAKCLAGPALLAGTGFDTVTGGCGNPPADSKLLGGGTGWLTTAGNVKPGDVMELRIAIWDTGDGIYDSLVLLDNWIWNLSPASPGTR